MQVCTSLQTDNHASTPPLSFFTGRMPFLPPNHQSTEGILCQLSSLHRIYYSVISAYFCRIFGVCMVCIFFKCHVQLACLVSHPAGNDVIETFRVHTINMSWPNKDSLTAQISSDLASACSATSCRLTSSMTTSLTGVIAQGSAIHQPNPHSRQVSANPSISCPSPHHSTATQLLPAFGSCL